MKSLKDISLIIVILFSIASFAGGYFAAKELRDDGPLEEAVEDVIEHNTGIQLDLSTSTPDPDQG